MSYLNCHATPLSRCLSGWEVKMGSYIQHLCKKLSQYCGLVCHLRQNITQKCLLQLYHSVVYHHLVYGILPWGSTNNSALHSLQVLQNRLVRIISRVRRSNHIANNSLYHKLNVLKIKNIYHLGMAKFLYLYYNIKLPKLFNQCFKSVNSVHLHLASFRTTKYF